MNHKMKFLITCLICVTSLCFGLKAESSGFTKEQLREIEESNKRAFEASKPKNTSLVAPSVEAENEVVTEEEFKTVQKKQKAIEKKKAAKTPTIMASTVYLKNPKSHVGKTFRIMMKGESMFGFECKKSPKPMCEWNYLIGDDGGFGAIVGDGFYSFECFDRKVCNSLEEVSGQETATRTVEVEMVDVVEFTDKQGRKRQAPLLKALRID